MDDFFTNLKEMRNNPYHGKGHPDVNNIRDSFLQEMTSFYETGILPGLGSREVKYYLENQAARLSVKGLELRKRFETEKDDMTNELIKSRSPFRATLSIRDCEVKTDFVKDGKTIKKIRNGGDFLYCSVLQRDGEESGEYTCPNCGHKALLPSFQDGCPMCGTKFEMPQTYPCVTNYFSIPQPANRRLIKKILGFCLIAGIAGGIGFALYFIIRYIFFEGMNPILAMILGILSGAVAGLACFVGCYLTCASIMLIAFIPMAIIQTASAADMAGTGSAKRKTEAAMKKYDPEFSFEFFEGRALSILRATAFSDDRGSLGVYRGTDDLSYMDDIVNIEYRGGIAFQRCGIYNDMIHMNIRAFMSDTYYRDGELKIFSDTFDLEFVRRPDVQTDIGSSVHAVNCRSCGASFDAVRQRFCPHCSSPYDLSGSDWILIKVDKN
ncbi:MAG: hypothetical protein J5685_03325 [Clostridiales bacterium]|nr:hypothetical protein [Clostridiales bacterium]